jgi:amino acid transporter
MGMADRGHLPKLFSHRSRHGTPTYGIILGLALIVVMGLSNLDALIELLNFNYAIALLMEYSAFIKLRISRPNLERPWRIPLNTFGCILLFTPTFLITFLVLGLSTYSTFIFTICTNAVGMLVFKAKERSERIRRAEEEAEKAEGSIATTTILTNDSAR